MSAVQAAPAGAGGAGVGFATGGAQDAANLRSNIAQGFLPLPTDVTFEGIVKDYFFDTRAGNPACAGFFCPLYSAALSPDPLLGEGAEQVYLAGGWASGKPAAAARAHASQPAHGAYSKIGAACSMRRRGFSALPPAAASAAAGAAACCAAQADCS